VKLTIHIHLVPKLRMHAVSDLIVTGSERKRALLRHFIYQFSNYGRWKEFRIILLSSGIFVPCILVKFPHERIAYISMVDEYVN
jgi:hypothetical protein